MNRDNCKKFDNCAAPLCPEDENIGEYCFYPDEEICTKHNQQFIKTQKKIAKRVRDKETYYTYEMLDGNRRISEGTTGLNPDLAEEPQLKKWLSGHPIARELDENDKLRISSRLQAARNAKSGLEQAIFEKKDV